MSEKNDHLGNFENAKEKMEEMQKMQTQFVSTMWNKSLELQQKQYALLTSIMQNQVEFGSAIFSGAMNMNDNLYSSNKSSARKK